MLPTSTRRNEKIPVLIIDNANRLAEKQLRLLEQDYAKRAADERTATIAFVSAASQTSEDRR